MAPPPPPPPVPQAQSSSSSSSISSLTTCPESLKEKEKRPTPLPVPKPSDLLSTGGGMSPPPVLATRPRQPQVVSKAIVSKLQFSCFSTVYF
jgi:hypothetical protein